MTRWRIALTLPVILLAVTVAACGSADTPSASPSASPEPSAVESTPIPTEEETASPEPTETPDSGETTIYTVKKGDTLVAIAARHNITLAALREANPQITDPRKLRIGAKLTIPSN
jgi:LysM repeat protein